MKKEIIESHKIAKLLLQINAIKLKPKNPFIWSSGKKSPIYCDNRLILSHPKIRTQILKKLTTIVLKKFKNSEVIAGVATAGIPHGALIANNMKLPFIYVRPVEKKHGRKNKIEGDVEKNKKVLIIEDLISTGKSSLNVVKTLRDFGCEIIGILSIFSYKFPEAIERIKKEKIEHFSLCDFDSLIKAAEKEKYISKQQLNLIKKWHLNF